MALTIEQIVNKEVTVGIVGIGYVGFPLALVFAEAGIDVIGFDIDEVKVEAIITGKSFIQHIDHGRLQKSICNKLKATSDFSMIAQCNAVIICVPTPLNHHLEPDISFVVQTAESIAPYLQPYTLVSLESTTWPGTTEEVLFPILEKISGLKVSKDLYLCFSPEREDPGNQLFSTKTIPKLLGAVDPESLSLGMALYATAAGIPSAIYYSKCVHEQPVFSSLGYKYGSMPISETAATEVLSLPMHPWLTEDDQNRVVDILRRHACAIR